MAELDAGGIAAVLAADAQTQISTGLTAIVSSHLDQLADADLIQMLERIALVDLVLVVSAEELCSIVTAEAEGSADYTWCSPGCRRAFPPSGTGWESRR